VKAAEEDMPEPELLRRNSSEEDRGYRSMNSVDSDELDGGLNLSDCEDVSK